MSKLLLPPTKSTKKSYCTGKTAKACCQIDSNNVSLAHNTGEQKLTCLQTLLPRDPQTKRLRRWDSSRTSSRGCSRVAGRSSRRNSTPATKKNRVSKSKKSTDRFLTIMQTKTGLFFFAREGVYRVAIGGRSKGSNRGQQAPYVKNSFDIQVPLLVYGAVSHRTKPR